MGLQELCVFKEVVVSAMYRGTVSDMSSNQNAAIAECASHTLSQD